MCQSELTTKLVILMLQFNKLKLMKLCVFCHIDNEYRLLSLVGCRSGESARRFNLLSPFFSSVGEQLFVLDRRIVGQQCQVLGDTEQWTKCTQDTAEHAGLHLSFDCRTPTCLVQ